MSAHARLVIASNRLPFTVQTGEGGVELQPSSGGLAAALSSVHDRRDDVWVGWPGQLPPLEEGHRAELMSRLRRRRIVPVGLSDPDVVAYYDGICNSVLWPVLHYMIDRLPLTLPEFQTYRAVNSRFADAIVAEYRPGDLVWIHDYHLLLAPAMVRARIPDAKIGFFLHTPFPAADVFRVLPWRRELLDGVLGSTLVGFQTERDAHNFDDSIRALTEYRSEGGTVIADRRRIRFGAYPIGIDPARFAAAAHSDADAAGDLCRVDAGRRLLVGVDRLDYTKGIPRRVAAFERLLESNQALRGQVELLQIAVPSRAHVPSYVTIKEQVDAMVARVNARFATPGWTPVRYHLGAVGPRELARIYRAADVMLVTSLRDGMNLVAKEFVSARHDEDGVLVLSELAGAADELQDALLVNPYSVEALADAIATALGLNRNERRRRMKTLREQVRSRSIEGWVERFTGDIEDAVARHLETAQAAAAVATAVETAVLSGSCALVLSYEGALLGGARVTAEPACPDAELLDLLRDVQTRAGISLHVVSTKDHHTLDRWFDGVPAVLWAEEGLWRRDRDGDRWRRTEWASGDWREDVRDLLQQFAARTPGAFVEERSSTLAWHFRRTDPVLGRVEAQTLAAVLQDGAGSMGFAVAVLETSIEVRPSGLSFDRTLGKIIGESAVGTRVVCMDSAERHAAARHILRRSDVFVATGPAADATQLSLADARALRDLLRDLARTLPAARVAVTTVPRTLTALRPGRRTSLRGLPLSAPVRAGIRIER